MQYFHILGINQFEYNCLLLVFKSSVLKASSVIQKGTGYLEETTVLSWVVLNLCFFYKNSCAMTLFFVKAPFSAAIQFPLLKTIL